MADGKVARKQSHVSENTLYVISGWVESYISRF